MGRSSVNCWDCGEILGYGSIGVLRCRACGDKFETATGGLDPQRFYNETTMFGEVMDDYLEEPEMELLRRLLEPNGTAWNDENRWQFDPLLEKLAAGNAVEIHKNRTIN